MEKKLTVIECAKLLGVSKEAIYNRIRRGSLKSMVENGVKYVLIDEEVKKTTKNKTVNSANDAYIELLKEELAELKERNRKLEKDKERLIREKEELLIDSKEKIEKIYKERDYQLKSILMLATKPLLENKKNRYEESEVIDEETIELDIEEEQKNTEKIVSSYDNWQDFRDYLKEKGYSKKEKKIIANEISKKVGKNENLKNEDGKIFIKKGKKLNKILKKNGKKRKQ